MAFNSYISVMNNCYHSGSDDIQNDSRSSVEHNIFCVVRHEPRQQQQQRWWKWADDDDDDDETQRCILTISITLLLDYIIYLYPYLIITWDIITACLLCLLYVMYTLFRAECLELAISNLFTKDFSVQFFICFNKNIYFKSCHQ